MYHQINKLGLDTNMAGRGPYLQVKFQYFALPTRSFYSVDIVTHNNNLIKGTYRMGEILKGGRGGDRFHSRGGGPIIV